ncbi:MAG: serine/threonine protein kinase [Nannocystaceae bacterium]|nr:serine/threonine protein kinase [Nannocystaceae bacterium]
MFPVSEATGSEPVFVPVEKSRVRAAVLAGLAGRAPESTTVGRYTLRVRLGQGAHGVVYRAYDPKLERDVALKLVLTPCLDRVSAVLAEAHALAKLAHPNVVAVYDAGETEHAVYIAMEWVQGMTLGDWFAQQPRNERETIRVMLDAGRGLAAAHAAGLVHRDFKPHNVMVASEGRVQVLDFGLARAATSPWDDSGPVGTPDYMSPEQRRGDPATALSDQYALCATFHEALTRRHPGRGRLSRGWLALAKPIIARGLREDPTQRHASVSALIRRFERRRSIAIASALMGAAGLGALFMWAILS